MHKTRIRKTLCYEAHSHSSQHVSDVRDLLATGKVGREGSRHVEINITRAHNNRVLTGWSECWIVEWKGSGAASISMNTALNCQQSTDSELAFPRQSEII